MFLLQDLFVPSHSLSMYSDHGDRLLDVEEAKVQRSTRRTSRFPSRTSSTWLCLILLNSLILWCFIFRQTPLPPRWARYTLSSLSSSSSLVYDPEAKVVGVDWSQFAYTQYVTNLDYLCNSVMLFERLHQLNRYVRCSVVFTSKTTMHYPPRSMHLAPELPISS